MTRSQNSYYIRGSQVTNENTDTKSETNAEPNLDMLKFNLNSSSAAFSCNFTMRHTQSCINCSEHASLSKSSSILILIFAINFIIFVKMHNDEKEVAKENSDSQSFAMYEEVLPKSKTKT